MAKPTYFKFFDGYIDTLRNCETHKDRSILLMAMFDFWESGVEPTIPKKLQDKWRFLYNSLKQSRIKSYQKLGEDLEETNMESSGNQPVTAAKTKEAEIDNQRDSQILCPQTAQSSSTYRIESKNKNKENRIDRDSDSTIQYEEEELYPHLHPLQVSLDEEWKEVCETQRQEYGYTEVIEPEVKELSSRSSNTDTNTIEYEQPTYPQQPVKPSYSNEELETAGGLILQRITQRYQQIGKPVPYTRVDAERDLDMDASLFYAAVRKLAYDDKVTVRSVQMSDGKTINSYTPKGITTAVESNQVVLPSKFLKNEWSNYTHYNLCEYFKVHPFKYDHAWNYDTFAAMNVGVMQKAREEQPDVSLRPNRYVELLWGFIQEYWDRLRLEPVPIQ